MLKVLEGKKTWIGSGFLALAAVVGFLTGAISDTAAMTILGVAFSVVGLGDKIQRYAPAILAELRELKDVQQKIAAGQKVDLASEVSKAGEIAIGAAIGVEK